MKNGDCKAVTVNAAVAQSVERRIGSAEVTGPIPVSSSLICVETLINTGFPLFLCVSKNLLTVVDRYALTFPIYNPAEHRLRLSCLHRSYESSYFFDIMKCLKIY